MALHSTSHLSKPEHFLVALGYESVRPASPDVEMPQSHKLHIIIQLCSCASHMILRQMIELKILSCMGT